MYGSGTWAQTWTGTDDLSRRRRKKNPFTMFSQLSTPVNILLVLFASLTLVVLVWVSWVSSITSAFWHSMSSIYAEWIYVRFYSLYQEFFLVEMFFIHSGEELYYNKYQTQFTKEEYGMKEVASDFRCLTDADGGIINTKISLLSVHLIRRTKSYLGRRVGASLLHPKIEAFKVKYGILCFSWKQVLQSEGSASQKALEWNLYLLI